jgi:hypothetical protein
VSGTIFATVDVGVRPVKDDENRRGTIWLRAARSNQPVELLRPSNCVVRSVRD